MNEFCLKGKIMDEDFMIHIFNNLLEECNVILDGLINNLTVSGDDV